MIRLELTDEELRVAAMAWNSVPELACTFNEKNELTTITSLPEFESLGEKLAKAIGTEVEK